MKYGTLQAELHEEPVEVARLAEGYRSGRPFVSNHKQRGISLADPDHTMRLSTDEALTLLAWLQAQEPALRRMVSEEAEALANA